MTDAIDPNKTNEQPETSGDQELEPEMTPLESLKKQLDEAQQEIIATQDKLLRKAAEFDNFRKRTDRDRDQQRSFMQMDIFRKLLPIVDDWDRAMENAPDELTALQWIEGIKLIHGKLHTMLSDAKVEPIESLGQPFDPNIHSALLQQPSNEFEAGTVCLVVAKGYRLGNDVLRPAQVAVSTGPAESNA